MVSYHKITTHFAKWTSRNCDVILWKDITCFGHFYDLTLWFGFLTIKKEKIVDDKYTEWPSDSVEWELPYDLSITPERQPVFYYCVVKFIW